MANPELPSLIRSLRVGAGLSQKDLALKVGCSPSMIWLIEGGKKVEGPGVEDSPKDKVPLPSPDMLRRIARACAPSEESVCCLRLMLARAREVVPAEVRPFLSDHILTPMPHTFLVRLQRDLSKLDTQARKYVEGQLGIGSRLETVLMGIGQLSREEVIKLAAALKEPVDEYLMTAGFLSDGVRLVVDDFPECVAMLDVVGQLKPESRAEIQRFQSALDGLATKGTH